MYPKSIFTLQLSSANAFCLSLKNINKNLRITPNLTANIGLACLVGTKEVHENKMILIQVLFLDVTQQSQYRGQTQNKDF